MMEDEASPPTTIKSNGSTDMNNTSKDAQHPAKGFRYAVVDIGIHASDRLYDLLIENGYNDFAFLNNLADHPHLKKPVAPEASQKSSPNVRRAKDSQVFPTTPNVPATLSSPMFEVAKEEIADIRDEVPFFEEVSATDLLGAGAAHETIQQNRQAYSPEVIDLANTPSPFSVDSNYTEKDETENALDDCSTNENAAHDSDTEFVAVDLAKKPTSVPKGDYITCLLCKNMIMVSRFTNLTNHARRHAVIKKYCCAHCAFQQNERAKVRMHMLTVHHDDSAQVVVNSTPANIKLWNYLVRKCFPNYVASIDAKWKEVSGEEREHDFNTESEYKCVECGECLVVSDPSVEDELSMLTLMENHLKVIHNTQCVKCVCLVCGYENADQWDVSWHLSQRHTDASEDISMSIEPKSNYQQLITKYFPSAAELTYARLTSLDEQPLELYKGPPGMRESSSNSTDMELSDAEEERNPEKSLICRLCNRPFEIDDLPSIVSHAKAHYLIKQFECEWCGYGNNNKAIVSQHVYFKHRLRRVKIVEHNDKIIKIAWTQVVRACFPSLAWKLKEMRERRSFSPAAKKARDDE